MKSNGGMEVHLLSQHSVAVSFKLQPLYPRQNNERQICVFAGNQISAFMYPRLYPSHYAD